MRDYVKNLDNIRRTKEAKEAIEVVGKELRISEPAKILAEAVALGNIVTQKVPSR